VWNRASVIDHDARGQREAKKEERVKSLGKEKRRKNKKNSAEQERPSQRHFYTSAILQLRICSTI